MTPSTLIKTEPIDLDGHHRGVVCLPEKGVHIPPDDSDYVQANFCYTAGWGETGYNTPNILQSARVSIFSWDYCVTEASDFDESSIDEGAEFCAGYMAGGRDSCRGDSGGPLVCVVDGYPILYGITSWGYDCGAAGAPGVYAKVAPHIGWFEEHILQVTTEQIIPTKPTVTSDFYSTTTITPATSYTTYATSTTTNHIHTRTTTTTSTTVSGGIEYSNSKIVIELYMELFTFIDYSLVSDTASLQTSMAAERRVTLQVTKLLKDAAGPLQLILTEYSASFSSTFGERAHEGHTNAVVKVNAVFMRILTVDEFHQGGPQSVYLKWDLIENIESLIIELATDMDENELVIQPYGRQIIEATATVEDSASSSSIPIQCLCFYILYLLI